MSMILCFRPAARSALGWLAVLLALLCAGCAGSPAPAAQMPTADSSMGAPQPTGSASASGATAPPAVTVAGAAATAPPPSNPEPAEAGVLRKVAVEAPRQILQGRQASLYLSFGAPERQPNLPGEPGSQQSSGSASLPPRGRVRPGLDVSGGLRADPVEVSPISVENSIPKRWHWRISVPEDEEAGPTVSVKPYLIYSETPDGPERVIWPDQEVVVRIEVVQPPAQRRLLRFLGDTSSVLQLFGASLVMLMTWLYGFGRWLWPRLRTTPQPAPAPPEEVRPEH